MSRVPGTFAGHRPLRALVLIPDIEQPGLTDRERMALHVRNSASVTFACACGGHAPPPRVANGTVEVAPFEHEPGCPAVSPVLDRLAERLGGRLRYVAIPVEIPRAA